MFRHTETQGKKKGTKQKNQSSFSSFRLLTFIDKTALIFLLKIA